MPGGMLWLSRGSGIGCLAPPLPAADARASSEPRRPLLVPDAIAGDCDSIRPDVAAHFQAAHGVPLLVDEDQDCHDMVKCVRAAQAAWRRSGESGVSAAQAAWRRCPRGCVCGATAG